MADCNETLRELETFLDGELTDDAADEHPRPPRGLPRLPPGVRLPGRAEGGDRRKCRNDEMPPGLLARIEQCFQADLDGDGRIG